jgi:uncharacterized membrane protein YhaH (DUF805 family)
MKRVEFLVMFLIASALTVIIGNFYSYREINEYGTGEIVTLLICLVITNIIMPLILAWVRLQDAGHSKWLSFLMIVPIINLYPFFICVFSPTAQPQLPKRF